MNREGVPEWVNYPGQQWVEITPEEAGLNVDAWERLLDGK